MTKQVSGNLASNTKKFTIHVTFTGENAKSDITYTVVGGTEQTLSLASGFIVGIFGVVMTRQLLVLISSPTDVIDLSTIYLRIYFCGMPANMFYNFGAAILRAQGDTRRPLYYLTFAGVVNVVLNLILVIVFHMDVAGVALATIAAQYISAGLVLRCLLKETGPLRLDLKRLRLEWPVVRQIMQIGLPAGFQDFIKFLRLHRIRLVIPGASSCEDRF